MNPPDRAPQGVGPVLRATPLGRAMVAAIQDDNDGVTVQDEGAYLRVSASRVCHLRRSAVEATTGHAVDLPGDLEVIMSSFSGLVAMDEEGAVWWQASGPRPQPPA
jgi:toluene monooxygenase system protein D